MPVSIAAINAPTDRCTVPWGQDSCEVTYRAGGDALARAASTWQEQIQALQTAEGPEGEARAKAFIAEMVVAFVTSWDVLEEDGAAYPLTSEAVARLDTWFLVAVLQGVAADFGKKKASMLPLFAPSAATSSPMDGSTPSPTNAVPAR